MSGAQGDKTGEFGAITLAKGVMATQDLIQPDEEFVIAPDNFQRVITYVQDLTFNYGYQSSAVKSAEYRDEDWKATKDLFALAASADSVNVIGVTTTSYASPEGEISLNEDLAMDRHLSSWIVLHGPHVEQVGRGPVPKGVEAGCADVTDLQGRCVLPGRRPMR